MYTADMFSILLFHSVQYAIQILHVPLRQQSTRQPCAARPVHSVYHGTDESRP